MWVTLKALFYQTGAFNYQKWSKYCITVVWMCNHLSSSDKWKSSSSSDFSSGLWKYCIPTLYAYREELFFSYLTRPSSNRCVIQSDRVPVKRGVLSLVTRTYIHTWIRTSIIELYVGLWKIAECIISEHHRNE